MHGKSQEGPQDATVDIASVVARLDFYGPGLMETEERGGDPTGTTHLVEPTAPAKFARVLEPAATTVMEQGPKPLVVEPVWAVATPDVVTEPPPVTEIALGCEPDVPAAVAVISVAEQLAVPEAETTVESYRDRGTSHT